VATSTIAAVELTPVQQRTVDQLIRIDVDRRFTPDVEGRLRSHLEAAAVAYRAPRPLRLSKERLNEVARCQGLYLATLSGERPPFEFTYQAARGTLLHKSVEVAVGARDDLDPHLVAERAASRLAEDRRFGAFWAAVGPLAQDELLMESARGLELFRASFPPMGQVRRVLAPVTEVWLEARLACGFVVVSGRVDLMLHRSDGPRSTRLLLDLKSGRAWPDYPEDMRLYALLYTLRYGVPPYRVATLFLESGQWQSEDVTEETLDHAADRVAQAIGAADQLLAGRTPELSPGPHCAWCPRGRTCPASLAMGQVEREGFDPSAPDRSSPDG
jgi:hypothetical protein